MAKYTTQYLSARKAGKQAQRGYEAAEASAREGRRGALQELQPYTQTGMQGLGVLSSLLMGKRYDEDTKEFTNVTPEERMALFQESPGYQFSLSEGLKALESTQAARGGLFSGRALREAQTYGQGMASQEYQTYLDRLAQLTGVGQASAGQAAQVITGSASQIGQAQLGRALAGAQATIARGKAISGAFSDAAAAAGYGYPGGGAGSSGGG